MGEVEILQRIIEEEGSCCWASPSVCLSCPLSSLKVKQDGSAMNCIEAIGVEGLSAAEADKKYKEAAVRALLDAEVDSVLKD
jgi:hypothetical protein